MKRFRSMMWTLPIALLLAAALSACGSADRTAPAPAGNEPPPQAAVPPPTATKRYEAANGEVEIPSAPERIAVVSRAYLGHLLALGVRPVGAPNEALDNPFLTDMIDGIDNLGAGEVSAEKIATLEPDLILTATVDDASYEQYRKIAPTVQIPWGRYDFRETLTQIGIIVDKEEEAAAWLDEFDRQAAEAKKKLAEAVGEDETISIIEVTDKAFYVYGSNYGRGGEVLYETLGFRAPDKVRKEVIEGQGWSAISLETLPEYAADRIILSVPDNAGSNAETILESSIWRNLPAVKNGHVYRIDAKSFYNSDPISLRKEMDILVDLLTSNQS